MLVFTQEAFFRINEIGGSQISAVLRLIGKRFFASGRKMSIAWLACDVFFKLDPCTEILLMFVRNSLKIRQNFNLAQKMKI